MTIKETLKEICDKQIPKEINGVSTKYFIRDYRSVIGNRVVEISILPTNISKDNMGVTHRYSDEYYMDYDYYSGGLGHDRLVKDIRDLLCWYICNINEWTEGRDESTPDKEKGHWEKREVRGQEMLCCSKCGGDTGTIYEYDFCPNCGIEM